MQAIMTRLRYQASLFLKSTCLLIAIAPLSAGLAAQSVLAQAISGDSSLSTRITSAGTDFTIHDGTLSGPNLFHSFTDFSVPSGGSATFSNASSVVNIIGRVTGTNASTLDGEIGANGLANLFLLNPNGIIIGPQAELKIGGSFVGSTAESMVFANGDVFAVNAAGRSPLLSINVPAGLQLGTSSGTIEMAGGAHKLNRQANATFSVISDSNLSVMRGRTLAFVGDGISLDGGRLSTTGGRLELGSVALGEVNFSSVGAGYSFDYSKINEFADIEISQTLVDGISQGGGLIHLQGQNISVQDGAEIYIQNQAPIATSGGIIIDASQTFTMVGVSPVTNIASAITVESLAGPSGDLSVSAQNVELLGTIGIESIAGLAPGGNVVVNATDSILITPSAATPNNTTGVDTLSYGPAPAGNLTIKTDQLTLLGGSTIASFAYATGNSGEVSVTADAITVDGIESRRFRPSIIASGTLNRGSAGNVFIKTDRLSVSNGGRIDSSTAASGNAGSVTINALESVTVSDRVAGSINPSLIISGANLLDPVLRAEFNLLPFPTGNSGDLIINTPLLSVLEGAQVTVRNDGTGIGGTLRVTADSVRVRDAGITASTQAGGGGNISLTSTGPVLFREGSTLSAEAGGVGDGGNITLSTPFLIALENSDIIANAFEGDGGKIDISTRSLLGTAFREQQTAESDITASSQFGVSGIITISNIEVDPSSGIVVLSENFADYSTQIAAGCSNVQQNQFIASGRGGLASNPTHQVVSHRVWTDYREIAGLGSRQPAADISSAAMYSGQRQSEETAVVEFPLVEASRWSTDGEGQVVLHIDSETEAAVSTAVAGCLDNRIS